MKKQNPIRVFGLSPYVIEQLQQMALKRYGKDSASLMLRKLAEEQVEQPENSNKQQINFICKENIPENPRFTVSWLPEQYRYLLQKSILQHDSMNSIIRDIVQEHITKNPVLSNDAVQALYQSNYQLLRIGRNINQLARQFNAILPLSITTQQLNAICEYIDFHTGVVGKVLQNQGKSFKYRPIRDLNHAISKQTN